MTKRVAVIGAGLAGLSCARTLRRAGFYVDVFEQDRIVGGRMATMRLGLVPFDHGAQYLTARSDRFRAYMDELIASGYAARWAPKTSAGEGGAGQLVPWFVGTPGMSSLVRPLAESVRLHTERRVHTLQRDDRGWFLWFVDETHAGPFNAVAVAVPAAEARLLLGRIDVLADQISAVRMAPSWALIVRLDERHALAQDVYSDMSDVIRWIARNSSKPGRTAQGESLVIHASPPWSRETLDADPELVATELWNEACHVLSLPPIRPAKMAAHLWRHALVEASLGETYLFSTEHMVGVCGDWCLGRLAEHAFESGARLGKAIIEAVD